MPIDLTVGMISATVEIDQPQEQGQPRIVGTGFLVQAPRPDGAPRTVLVTAAHVFNNMPGPVARVGWRLHNPDGTWQFSAQPLAIRDGARLLWVKNPTADIAAIEVIAPPEFAKAAIPMSWLAEETSLAAHGIETGDEMFVLGYPAGFSSNNKGFPILRAGRVASYPLTPIKEYPSFLLDFRVLNGNSGGPVFITPDLQRHAFAPQPAPPPAAPKGADSYPGMVAGILTQQTNLGDEHLELGIVLHAVFVRQTIALLDQTPPTPPAAAPAGSAP